MVAEGTPRTTRTGARKSVLTHELPSSLLSFSSPLLFFSPLLSSSLPVPPLPSSPPLFPFSPPQVATQDNALKQGEKQRSSLERCVAMEKKLGKMLTDEKAELREKLSQTRLEAAAEVSYITY